jgi:TorA maturation chaperone TorD
MRPHDPPIAATSEALSLAGCLLLDGADTERLAALRSERIAAELASVLPGPLGVAMAAIQAGLDGAEPDDLAIELTRLMLVPTGGARGKILVPPWEDCWVGPERQILGERSAAATRAYASAGIGFDGMGERPADHIGLELCFVAALLTEEQEGARDGSVRRAFVREHLTSFAPILGGALRRESRQALWAALGEALEALPAHLGKLDRGALPVVASA